MKFTFDKNACKTCNGACCNGTSGYIWVNKKEILQISDFLNISTEKFINKFLFKASYKFSIKEIENDNNFACIFYDEISKNCSIYKVRPDQCRTYPFWEEIIKNPYSEALICPGILIK